MQDVIESRLPFVFLGYRAVRPWIPGPGWRPIEFVCNAGEDLCEPHDDWLSMFDFNRAACYATPEEAWATVPEERDAYAVFAYELLPVRFHLGEEPIVFSLERIFRTDAPDLPIRGSDLAGLDELGYDVAEKNLEFEGFPYSPLVTNGFAGNFRVNRYGLIDDLPTATEAAALINRAMPEHGDHWVVRIWGDADDLARLSLPS